MTSNRFFVLRSSLSEALVEPGGQKPPEEAGGSVLAAVILLWNP